MNQRGTRSAERGAENGKRRILVLILSSEFRAPSSEFEMTLNQLQELIRTMYGAKDSARGTEGTFMWFMEEVGELSAALRGGSHEERVLEFADVLAWLATLANIAGVDLEQAIRAKYGAGCPGCGRKTCECGTVEKP